MESLDLSINQPKKKQQQIILPPSRYSFQGQRRRPSLQQNPQNVIPLTSRRLPSFSWQQEDPDFYKEFMGQKIRRKTSQSPPQITQSVPEKKPQRHRKTIS